jgi:hypothetical protein
MNLDEVVTFIDGQIKKLQEAREVLVGIQPTSLPPSPRFSPETRRKMSEHMKRRWAAKKVSKKRS